MKLFRKRGFSAGAFAEAKGPMDSAGIARTGFAAWQTQGVSNPRPSGFLCFSAEAESTANRTRYHCATSP